MKQTWNSQKTIFFFFFRFYSVLLGSILSLSLTIFFFFNCKFKFTVVFYLALILFIMQEVEPMNKECDHIHITALTSAVGIPVRVEYMDRGEGGLVNHHDFPECSKPAITLLYRPGHYDILYWSNCYSSFFFFLSSPHFHCVSNCNSFFSFHLIWKIFFVTSYCKDTSNAIKYSSVFYY